MNAAIQDSIAPCELAHEVVRAFEAFTGDADRNMHRVYCTIDRTAPRGGCAFYTATDGHTIARAVQQLGEHSAPDGTYYVENGCLVPCDEYHWASPGSIAMLLDSRGERPAAWGFDTAYLARLDIVAKALRRAVQRAVPAVGDKWKKRDRSQTIRFAGNPRISLAGELDPMLAEFNAPSLSLEVTVLIMPMRV